MTTTPIPGGADRAVAVYALVAGGDSADGDKVEALEDRLAKTERQLIKSSEESDIRDVERRLRRTGEEGDVQALDRRVAELEEDTERARKEDAENDGEIERLGDRLDALASQVRRMEAEQDSE